MNDTPLTARIGRRTLRAAALALALLPLASCRTLGITSPGPGEVAKDATAEEIWEQGRALFAEGDWENAGDVFHECWSRFPTHELAGDAAFYEAESRYGMGKYRGAFVLYQSYLKDHPLSPHSPLVQKRLYDMGSYTMNAGRAGFLGLLDYSDEGIEILEYLVDVFPYGDHSDDALKEMADYEVADLQPHAAIEHLKELLQYYPGSEWVLEARLELARAYRTLNRGAEYDSDVLKRSLAEYRAYIEIVSSDPARKVEYADRLAKAESERDEVVELLAQKSMAKADYYLRTGQPEAAKNQLLNTVRRFPGTRSSMDARRQLGLGDADPVEPVAPEELPAEGGTR